MQYGIPKFVSFAFQSVSIQVDQKRNDSFQYSAIATQCLFVTSHRQLYMLFRVEKVNELESISGAINCNLIISQPFIVHWIRPFRESTSSIDFCDRLPLSNRETKTYIVTAKQMPLLQLLFLIFCLFAFPMGVAVFGSFVSTGIGAA